MNTTNLTASLLLTICITFCAYSQDKVKEKHLLGNWKMIIDVEDAFEEAKADLDEDDSILGKVVLSSVSGLVSGLLDELEIYMEFLPKGELKIMVNAFGEVETEYATWSIDKDGRLFLENTESVFSGDSDYWLFHDDVLVSYNESADHSDSAPLVYMINLD